MNAAGLHLVGEKIIRQKATVEEKVACRPIYGLCVEAKQMPVTIRMARWWDQDGVNEPEE